MNKMLRLIITTSGVGFGIIRTDALYGSSSQVKVLNQAEFDKQVVQSKEPWLVEFFASWCGHCKQLAPEFEKVAGALKGHVNVAAVEDQAVMGKYGVQGFPTIKFFGENKKSPLDYNGGRTADAIGTYAMEQSTNMVLRKLGKPGNASSGSNGGQRGGGGGGSGNDKDVVILTDSNFEKILMSDDKNVWFVEFYAPWCGHCKNLEPTWNDLATGLKGKVKVAKVDATVENVLGKRFGVQGFPTIKLFPPGPKSDSAVIDYNEGRDLNSLKNFANKYYMLTVEAEQLLSQSQFDEKCETTLCLIAFLPSIMDSSATERTKYLKDFNTAARAAAGVPALFFWSEGGAQFELEEKLNLGFGFPALIAIHRKKEIFVTQRGSFTQDNIRTFILGLSKPKHAQGLPKALPGIIKQKAWDGKDAPKEGDEL